MKTKIRAACLVALLAACQSEQEATASSQTVAGCDPQKLDHLIGQSQRILETLDLPQPLRVVRPGQPITMDHRPERTNIDLDKDGKIKRIWCG